MNENTKLQQIFFPDITSSIAVADNLNRRILS